MEKNIIFVPIIIFFVFFGILILIFIKFASKILKKSKESYWIGVVQDKVQNQKRDFDTNKIVDYYHLVVKMDDGSVRNISLSGTKVDDFNIGDRIEKQKGEWFPRKL